MGNLNSFRPEKKQRLTLFLDGEIVKKAKARAALDAETLSELVEKMLSKYIKF